MSSFVRPQRLNEALRYLMLHNPLYKDIQVLENWQSEWEVSEADLWAALTNDPVNNTLQIVTPIPSTFCDFQNKESMNKCKTTISESSIVSPGKQNDSTCSHFVSFEFSFLQKVEG